jgi:hypothetical protein
MCLRALSGEGFAEWSTCFLSVCVQKKGKTRLLINAHMPHEYGKNAVGDGFQYLECIKTASTFEYTHAQVFFDTCHGLYSSVITHVPQQQLRVFPVYIHMIDPDETSITDNKIVGAAGAATPFLGRRERSGVHNMY